ncbi:ABC transporter permease [Aquincola tertiaricarbonis]|uniref:ABC transporter permease n=1 Tax=Aquincola tertiaricarbonis TaxID=391953 RepID=A0ABY4S094_AQUTE|nr:ABC transporter permease [Aquincola tertiaricarbonis]URI06184.1 ABC transporter permease [Aquincola tertiaricarbonis]
MTTQTMRGAAAPAQGGLPPAMPVMAPPVPTLLPEPRPWWGVRTPIPRPRALVLVALGLLLPLLGWMALAASGWVQPVFMPGPGAVLQRMADWWADGLLEDVAISTLRVVSGWALSALIALPLGLLIGSFRTVQALLEPLTDFIRYMPAVAFIPLVMVWVGIDEGAKVAIIFIGTFFQMVLMVAEDVRRVPAAQIEAAQTLGATRGEIIQQVLVPSAKPALLDTLRVTMGWAWTYLVVAELVAASSGLGFAILKALRFLQTDKIFGGILLIGLIGLAIDQLMRLAHRKAFGYLYLRR